ncbi:protein phosphatase 1 regulatory subunit 12A-like isoform X4 [Poecile atricapillus]|uniref:protein phosphatase 1 regulatory subunit 12A-like isoform X3 n=1 Tax=Poecile atricapillus TaxID=48891 RepID=UPI00273A0EF7|nr:protein phosphatase 1 regulatory subunit 12A-like isoform X3 [Poecile atricapillus]XP_058721138.1 protein phosphatase 1 regulatory subunit 12A-like isoform X4 [Poecile atricapillus]
MKMADAKQKRNEQLKRWIGSETDLEPPVVKRKKTKVKFDDGAVFLAACSSGDTEEVLRLLERGADINYANVDGLTALHQACIDDNVDMVKFLVENGANINQPDNEGWIPLHAAASCGYLDIAEYLISQGAHVGAVNSEGDTPLDIAEEEAMEELLQNEVNRQGVDIESARKEEERIMLRDARQWLNSGHINDVRHAKSGGTALHVAAAKGYTEVLKLLIQAHYDVNIKDYDGWTPLHAAAHWGKEEACRILVENLCDMEAVNKVGQTAFDVADEDILGYLEELQKKQNLLHSEKREKKSPLIESTANMDNNQTQKTFKNKETLIMEQEKNASSIESLEQEKADEEEEGKKDESSCSSEEEEDDDSESEAETDKTKTLAANNANTTSTQSTSVAVMAPSVAGGQGAPTSPVKKFPTSTTKVSPKDEERKDESPASWRLGLRKTGSYGALAEITASKEAQKEKDSAGVMRSASSPRLSSSLDNKEKEKDGKGTRLAYVAPTIPRRLASTSDIDEKENRDSSASSIRGGSSYTRRKWEEDVKKNSLNEGPTSLNTSYQRSGSFGRRQDDLLSSNVPSTASTVTSSAGLQKTLPASTNTTTKSTTGSTSAGVQSSTSNRLWAEDSTEKEKDSVPTAVTVPVAPSVVNAAATTTAMTTATSGTVSSTSEVRERRRSYLTPVRDEESESQRKARSRQARQSRRSTQGVTLTDLQEAEKTIGRSRPTRTREQENEEKEKEEKEKQDKEKQEEKKESETKDDDYRQRYSRTVEEPYHRYRPTSTSTSSSSTSSLSTSTSSLSSSSQLNRPNSLIGITSAYSRSGTKESEREGGKKEEEKEEDKSQPKSIRERRRPREKRRSTGVSFWTQDSDENEQDHQSDSEEGTNKKETQSESLSRYDTGSLSMSAGDRYDSAQGRSGSQSYLEDRKPYCSRLEKDDSPDFKKLYEQILAENEKLKAQLHDTNMELTDLKLQLEKTTQRQERFADRSLLEMEKRERRALERRISEMEEELKMLPDLKADNQRLKDENGALIRVISKLSK